MICQNCVTHELLKKLICKTGQRAKCHYCENEDVALERSVFFEYIYDSVYENVAFKDDLSEFELAMIYACGSDYISVAGLDIVFAEWFELGDEPYFDELYANAPDEFKIDDRGNETHFYYDEGQLESNFYEDRWSSFIDKIQHTHRFFNSNATDFLNDVFSFLSSTGRLNPDCLRIMFKGDMLYRARKVGSKRQCKEIVDNPFLEFGAIPKHMASSQRMTPSGISALYCALERNTCLSEIRSITGDNVVSVALTPINELRLLDLTRLEKVELPNLLMLEKGFRNSKHLKVFINTLVKRMSKPKARDDQLAYLSTQVVFEFLRIKFGAEVDGLVFPSVQTGELGTNVVLFPENCILDSSMHIRQSDLPGSLSDSPFCNSKSKVKLAVVLDSIKYHQVTAIETKAKEFDYIEDLYMDSNVLKQLKPWAR